MAGTARQFRLGAARRAVQRRADAGAPRLQEALRERPADCAPRVSLPARAGLRLGLPESRRRTRRDRSTLQPQRRPRPHAGLRPRAADRHDDAAARGGGRRREDVEEHGKLRRRCGAARRNVRQADVDLRRADVAVLHAAHGPDAGRRFPRGSGRSSQESSIPSGPSRIWRR